MSEELHNLCRLGQAKLVETDYLSAEDLLDRAETLAWDQNDWDSLSRLYMPLQEARRQRRQRCGEGVVSFEFVARSASDRHDPQAIANAISHGQVLVAGWESIETALKLREIARKNRLYLDVFLASTSADGRIRVVADDSGTHAITLDAADLPAGRLAGSDRTYARTMSLWEQLHTPALLRADSIVDPIERMSAYRDVIKIDYACELAHQKLSLVASRMNRG
jgi:hypothetical protein